MKILFGGSFNPFTNGHLKIIKFLKIKFPKAKILVVPTNKNYAFYDKTIIDNNHRLNILKIVQKKFPGLFSISRYEFKNQEFLGTVITLRHFKHPYFVIGSDSLKTLKDWKESSILVKENHFIVIPRGKVNIDDIIETDFPRFKDHFTILRDFKETEESSEAFRETCDKNIVLDEVYSYIKKWGLYGAKDN